MDEDPATGELTDPPPDPYRLFASWYREAERCAAIKYAAAMCLSTVDDDGLPDGRTVLLEHFDADGFVFFTDVESRKGRALARFPEAALTFYWGPLDRQVRVRGAVEPAAGELADAFFARRPRASQITAWASRQSRPLTSRAELEDRYERFVKEFEGRENLPRPPHWQAYRLTPRTVELWQARARRLHDQLLFTRAADGTWRSNWLYP